MNQPPTRLTIGQLVGAVSMLAGVLMLALAGRRMRYGNPGRPLMGVVFAALFQLQSVLGDALATIPLPLPGVPAVEVARYLTESQSAVIGVAFAQILTAIALFVFATYVAKFVRRSRSVLHWVA